MLFIIRVINNKENGKKFSTHGAMRHAYQFLWEHLMGRTIRETKTNIER